MTKYGHRYHQLGCAVCGFVLCLGSIACGDNDDESDSTQSDQQDNEDGGTHDSGTGNEDAWPQGKYIAIDALYQRVQAKDAQMLLLNVSDEEYYEMGHIEGTVKIPWDLLATRLNEVSGEKHIVIYCKRGVRSESAYDTLIENGYSLVWVMEGGLEQWIADGYPVVPDKK